MTNLRERPLRLESSLTMDYINRAQKMREIDELIERREEHPVRQTFLWVLLGVLVVAILMSL